MKRYLGILFIFISIITASANQHHAMQATINVNEQRIYLDQTITWTNTLDHATSNIYISLNNHGAGKNPHISDTLNHAGYPNGYEKQEHTIQSITHKNAPLTHTFIDSTERVSYQTFNANKNVAKVSLNTPIQPKQTIQIRIKSERHIPNYAGIADNITFKDNIYLRFNWYPVIMGTTKKRWKLSQLDIPAPPHTITQFNATIDQPMSVGLSSTTQTIKKTNKQIYK